MATIRKRRGKWHVQVRHKGCPNVSRTFLRKADALQWANSTEIEIDRRGLAPDPKILERLTVSDLLARYRDTVIPSRRGHKNQTIIINAFLRHPIATTSLSILTPERLASYRDERLRNVRPATINRELGLVQHAFEVARKEWNIPLPVNPLREISKPKPDRPRERRLRQGEWERLLEALRKCRNSWMELVVRMALETGMRRSELLNARWRDVNQTSCILHIPVTKNGHPRTIPLSPQAMAVLIETGNDHIGDDPIFPMSAEAVKLAWQRLTARAEIEDLHFHDLRHEAVSRFFERGLTVPEVALISGHRDPRMLFRYTHLKAEDVSRKLSALGE